MWHSSAVRCTAAAHQLSRDELTVSGHGCDRRITARCLLALTRGPPGEPETHHRLGRRLNPTGGPERRRRVSWVHLHPVAGHRCQGEPIAAPISDRSAAKLLIACALPRPALRIDIDRGLPLTVKASRRLAKGSKSASPDCTRSFAPTSTSPNRCGSSVSQRWARLVAHAFSSSGSGSWAHRVQ
jgi:hypothetical protein